jgi:predicted DNA-binding transcriptional regulator
MKPPKGAAAHERAAEWGAAKPSAEVEILKLLFWRPQPDVQSIAAGLGLSIRSVRIHLQVLFRAGMLRRGVTREKTLCYDLAPLGKEHVAYERVMAGGEQVDYGVMTSERRLARLTRLVEGETR